MTLGAAWRNDERRQILAAWTGVVLCVGLAFSLACRLVDANPTRAQHGSVAARFLGETLKASSDSFYRMADRNFHKGVQAFEEKAFNDPLQDLVHELKPTEHAHLHGEQIKEIMFPLRMALWADPTNIEPYLVAAFWLTEYGRPDLAEQILREGFVNNPSDYQIRLELARLCLKTGRLRAAETQFEQALNLWPGKEDPADSGTIQDKAQIFLYQALLHELAGRTNAAIAAFKAAFVLRPGRRELRLRIRELEQGITPPLSPRAVWQRMLLDRKHVCPYETAEEHDHEHTDPACPVCGEHHEPAAHNHEHHAHEHEHSHEPHQH